MEVFTAIRDGRVAATRLQRGHPLVQFVLDPTNLNAYLNLDDTVIWGCLPVLKESRIAAISTLAERLLNRQFYKCLNVSDVIANRVKEQFPHARDERRRQDAARKYEAKVRELIADRRLLARRGNAPKLMADLAERNPYRVAEGTDGALNQMWVVGSRGLQDLGALSDVVRALIPFRVYRLYYRDDSAKETAEGLLREVLQ